jgi:RNA polymerase sigma-70 factor (ECF subfamily)
VYGYLLRMSRRGEVADELFQETFLRVHRARSTWSHHHGSFRSWLYRIATNVLRDRARSAARRPEVVGLEWSGAEATSPSDRIALERALGNLPDNLRDAFVLTAMLGMDHHEVAAALEISPDNARARTSRARARLRESLGEA